MSNKTNHRRPHGHVRRRNPHSPGRRVCGVCGPTARVQRNAVRETDARKDTKTEVSLAQALRKTRPAGWNGFED